MPTRLGRAHEASHDPTRQRASAAVFRIALGAIFALSVLSIPQLTAPDPVAASSSCTGWTSKASPPRSIRVLRTSSGRVEQVEFRRYVAEVMASGEWPSRLNKATLEAGALATKQYAWYYTMKGHHRAHYVRGGKCYDVRDDTMDQLYRPERAKPTNRQWQAINKTWNLTLRKNGRFFLTGYRAGVVGSCAGDANGWKLYEKSVDACANRGWSSKRILKKYLSPNLAFVRTKKGGPIVADPKIKLTAGNVVSEAVTVTWRPFSRGADIASYKLQRQTGRGDWKTVTANHKVSKRVGVWLKSGYNNRFRVKATDGKGNSGPWAYSPRRKAAIRGPVGRILSGATAHTVAQTAVSHTPKARMRFKGRSIGFVTRTGPGMGKARIMVNGKRVAVVDLERATTTDGKLVWTRNWKKAKKRTVVVKAADPRARVDFKGFYILY